LLAQPNISFLILRLLLSVLMARPVDFHYETPFVADEIGNEFSNHRLTAELGAFASAVSNGAPDRRLSLHKVSAMLAGEAKQDGGGMSAIIE
jgi:hypothetical protein